MSLLLFKCIHWLAVFPRREVCHGACRRENQPKVDVNIIPPVQAFQVLHQAPRSASAASARVAPRARPRLRLARAVSAVGLGWCTSHTRAFRADEQGRLGTRKQLPEPFFWRLPPYLHGTTCGDVRGWPEQGWPTDSGGCAREREKRSTCTRCSGSPDVDSTTSP